MKLSENVRSKVFWIVDTIKGNKIRHHYHNVKLLLETDESEIAARQRSFYLQKLLEHATRTTS